MSTQDIRIVELLKRGHAIQPAEFSSCPVGYSAITYYDKISVHCVNLGNGEAPLRAAYQKMQTLFADGAGESYESRQMMVAFTDIRNSRVNGHTKTEIDTFWDDENPAFFFMTMINISLSTSLEKEVRRIREILNKKTRNRYLLYLTYDYSEILIFFKGNSFREFSSLVMKIGFGKDSSGVLDTITVCSFNSLEPTKICDENLRICVQMGIKDYKEATSYLQKTGVKLTDVYWLLGRNDIAFVTGPDGMRWIQAFCMDNCVRKSSENHWFSTANFIILIPKDINVEPSLEEKPQSLCPGVQLEERIKSVSEKYAFTCGEMNIRKDEVFIRMLGEIWTLIRNVQDTQLAQDLVICILPELDDFLTYLERVLEDGQLKDHHAGALYNCINAFYINMLALISNTVHSNQEFVQIPHSALPGFEMPPKVMAYYGLTVREIIQAFQDEQNLYGVMLSPKLVDELEVVSLAIKGLPRKDQLLSVNIGEGLLYDMSDTITTLGHEMAHFVGECTRKRETRRQKVLACYTYKLLDMLCGHFAHMLPATDSAEENISADCLLNTATKISESIVEVSPCERPLLRQLFPQIENLAATILYNEAYSEQIYQEVICPTFQRTVREEIFMVLLGGERDTSRTSSGLSSVCVDARMRRLFNETRRRCLEYWTIYTDQEEFNEYIGYLFTESYADLAMTMLFDMRIGDYARVFARGMRGMRFPSGEVEDATELTRFIAVVRTIFKKKEGQGGYHFPKTKKEEGNWDRALREAAKLVTSRKRSALYKYCIEKKINVAYMTYLVEYLDECFDELSKQLHTESGQFTDAVRKLQSIYDTVDHPSSILTQLGEIRNLELSFLSRYTSDQGTEV